MVQLLLFFFSLISLTVWSQEIPYGTGDWDRQKLGNHRAVIQVMKDTDVAWAHIPWRRRDDNPADKAVIMVDASSGKVGMREAEMIGYWDQDNPVKPDDKDIKVTVYKRPDSLLIAYASWAKNDVQVTLHIDWNRIGMAPDQVKITAPAMENFQQEREYSTLENITVPVGKGGIILIRKK